LGPPTSRMTAENPHMAGMVGTQFVPVEGEKVSSTSGKFSKYSDTNWKPLVGPKTPLSMMQAHPDSSHYPDTYTKESRGVVPGYQGHVPRARDTFGSTAVGGLSPDMHIGAHKKMGVMSGHEQQAYGSKRVEGPLGAGELNSAEYTSFSEKKIGVMPGYAGFRPGSRDHYGDSAFGGIPHDGNHGEGPDLKGPWDRGRGGPGIDYKVVVNGILPGYKGHVPEAINKHGTSHFGSINARAGKGAQLGHENVKGDQYVQNDVGMYTKSGYSGHVPRARDAFGTTTYNPK